MFRKPVKTAEIDVDGRRYAVCYFEQKTLRGGFRYSGELYLGGSDRIIIDDDSMPGLESKVARLAPAMIYSRLLAAPRTVAA
jgi:hypothetical protein